ncbi:MAG: hypothetical protein ABEI32_05940 [Halothece sp.]|jgi:hypothetical protein
MNIKMLTTGTKTVLLGLLTVSALGAVSLPAKGDNAVIQESTQESVITGEGNVSGQSSYQRSSVEERSRGHSEEADVGVVQSNRQYCDQYGARNVCAQSSDQRSDVRTNNSRHTRPGHGRRY